MKTRITSTARCASELNLSTNFFGDLIKKRTGNTAQEYIQSKLIDVTNEKIFDALCAGASGYLLKKTVPSKIVEAINDVYTGGTPMTPEIAKKVLSHFSKQPLKNKAHYNLTDREKDILFCLTQGYSYKMIAAQLQISIDTVAW